MGTILNLLNGLKDLDFPRAVERSIIGTEMFVIDYNQKQLYENSLNADGESLDLYRGMGYALYKNRLNSKPGLFKPDLFVTGDFYRGFYMDVKNGYFEIDSRDGKSDKLKARFGDKIFGLTDESKEEYAHKEFWATLKRIIESRTGLKIQ